MAAARIHQGLLERGVQSRFCVAYPTAGLEGAFTPAVSRLDRLARSLTFAADARRLRAETAKQDYVLSTGAVGFDMGRIIAAEQPDVVQLHWIAGRSFRLSSLKATARPIVWRLSDMWPFCGLEHLEPDPAKYVPPPSGPGLSEQVRRRKQALYATLPSLHLAAPSRWLAAQTAGSALLGDRPIHLIATSCDTRLFTPHDRATSRSVLGLDPDARIVLVGATSMGTRWKGMDLFVEAVAQAAASGGGPIQVVTFGHDAFGADLLGGQVELVHLGPVRDRRLMSILYSAADVYAAPSRMENLSNAVLEALACGTPVVAFDIGGMPDMIDHQVNGCLAQPFDTAQMAQGLLWALERRGDPGLRETARRKVLDGFSLDGEIGGYIELYERLSGRKGAISPV